MSTSRSGRGSNGLSPGKGSRGIGWNGPSPNSQYSSGRVPVPSSPPRVSRIRGWNSAISSLVSEITQARIVTAHETCAAVHVKRNVPPVQSPTGDPSSVENSPQSTGFAPSPRAMSTAATPYSSAASKPGDPGGLAAPAALAHLPFPADLQDLAHRLAQRVPVHLSARPGPAVRADRAGA